MSTLQQNVPRRHQVVVSHKDETWDYSGGLRQTLWKAVYQAEVLHMCGVQDQGEAPEVLHCQTLVPGASDEIGGLHRSVSPQSDH